MRLPLTSLFTNNNKDRSCSLSKNVDEPYSLFCIVIFIDKYSHALSLFTTSRPAENSRINIKFKISIHLDLPTTVIRYHFCDFYYKDL